MCKLETPDNGLFSTVATHAGTGGVLDPELRLAYDPSPLSKGA